MYDNGFSDQPREMNVGGYMSLLNFNSALSNNDPSILCINGNSYTIKRKGD